jgi:hypothetical protein
MTVSIMLLGVFIRIKESIFLFIKKQNKTNPKQIKFILPNSANKRRIEKAIVLVSTIQQHCSNKQKQKLIF